MHTQKETARFLVEDKKADYVFTVKDNQPTLRLSGSRRWPPARRLNVPAQSM
jgi:hypothetical protein